MAGLSLLLRRGGLAPHPVMNDYIRLEDPVVFELLMAKGISTDGIGITLEDAAAVTQLGSIFKNNANVTRFDEMRFFTSFTKTEVSAFQGTGFVSIDLSNIQEVGQYSFMNNTKLEAVNLQSATILRTYCFQACSSMKYADIGDKITMIYGASFRNCTAMQYIICRATSVPVLENKGAFDNTNNCPIYVPDASLDAYKAASNWSSLASRIKPLSEFNG